jgi:hypothetical protein
MYKVYLVCTRVVTRWEEQLNEVVDDADIVEKMLLPHICSPRMAGACYSSWSGLAKLVRL